MFYWAWWAVLSAYSILAGPPMRNETWLLVQRLATFQWEGIEPILVAHWNLMGLWPMLFSATVIPRQQKWRPRATWFIIGSFFLGAFALLPYFALRREISASPKPPHGFAAVLAAPAVRLGIELAMVGVALIGIFIGDPDNFAALWRADKFVHIMGLDFMSLLMLYGLLALKNVPKSEIE